MASEKALELIRRANQQLGKARVKLEVSGKKDWISLRGTFPPKPGSNKRQPHQQRISLKMRAVDWQTVREALTQAKEIDLELNRGTFSWYKLDGFEDPNAVPTTIAEWVKKLERDWWSINSNRDTWRTKYQYPLRPLVDNFGQQELSVELLKRWIVEYSEKGTDARKRFCHVAKQLAELAGLPTNELKLYKSTYNQKSVSPRDLPSDEEIIRTGLAIKDPGWRFIYGTLATYGLRPHEVFKFDQLGNGRIMVREDTKTGTRTVPPLHSEWAEKFNLTEVVYPRRMKFSSEMTNSDLGEKISWWFKSSIGWNAYNLRHAYSRRWFEKGLPSDVAAKFMGHSPSVHVQTYRAWIDEQVYLDIANRLT